MPEDPRDKRLQRILVEHELVEGSLGNMPPGIDTDFATLDALVSLLRRYVVNKSADFIELWGRRKKHYLVAIGGGRATQVKETIGNQQGQGILPAEATHAPVVYVNGNGNQSQSKEAPRGIIGGKRA